MKKFSEVKLLNFEQWILMACIFLGGHLLISAEDVPKSSAPVPKAIMGEYDLADFGSVKTAAEAQATLDAAVTQILASGGGTLVVGPGANPDWVIVNLSPSSTRRGTPSITIIDRRDSREDVILPSNGRALGSAWTGRHLSRTVNQPIDMAFGVHSTQTIDTYIAGGTTSWYFPCLFDIKKGKDQRIYVPTIRGLFEGMAMVLYAPDKQEQVFIKSLGWDAEKKLYYAVADIENNHAKGTVGDKHVVNSVTLTDHSQSDNQSMGLIVSRQNYGMGDSFVISASSRSMGNIMSCTGDEGAACYQADIYNDLSPFRSTVESMDWKKSELVYAPGATRNYTLGTSRPVINMNTKKHVIAGTIYVVAQGNKDPWDVANPAKTGRTFEKQVYPGGAIIGSKDCGWTDEIVGRFFAVDEPSEYLDPKNDADAGYTTRPDMRTYRWYQIQKLEVRPDGTKRIYVERTRWFSRNDIVPNLYLADNYTWDGHLKPMHYIIASGAYVADISRAWTDSEASGGQVSATSPRTLKLAPSPDAGGKFDFEKSDPIVQAIGQDPWNPCGYRVRHHNYLPSTIEDSSFSVVNLSTVQVNSAFGVGGGSMDMEGRIKESKDHLPAFHSIIDIGSTSHVGLRFAADVVDAAIKFEQPGGRPQPIVWSTTNGASSSLTVDTKTGDFLFKGGNVRMPNVILTPNSGISGSTTPAHNLRGIALSVKSGATQLEVQLERPEADAKYSVLVQPNWLTTCATSKKTEKGFVITFANAATNTATIDWILIR